MTARPFLLGLTGSIGMGKTTTAGMFAEEGVPVWDADEAVHRLYKTSAEVVEGIGKICPEAIVGGGVDLLRLRNCIVHGERGKDILDKIEKVIHPKVREDRTDFIERAGGRGDPLVVLDIPLLYETGAESEFDAVLVVTVAKEIQRRRVLERPDMTIKQLERLLARQAPDARKRGLADFVIETNGVEQARESVKRIIAEILSGRDTHA